MSKQTLLTDQQLERFRVIANLGLDNASKAIAEMSGLQVTANNSTTVVLPINEIPSLVGGEEERAVGVFLEIEDDIHGHMLLLWSYSSACRMVDVLLEQLPGTTTTINNMGESAIKEVGNMVGSFFLNAMADFLRLRCTPSPPLLLIDQMGSILDSLAFQAAKEGEHALVVDTTFKEGSHTVIGNFMLIPSVSSLDTLVSRLGE